MSHDNDDDRPWTEVQWAKFMKEGDVRAARYGELLETFIDDPDCHEKVAREMGWDVDEDGEDGAFGEADDKNFDFAAGTTDDEIDDPFQTAIEELEAAIDGQPTDAARVPSCTPRDRDDDDNDELSHIPAYAAARECGRHVDRILEPWMNQDTNVDLDERIPEIWTNIHVAAAKISGGHAMGYEDEVLCGNIVCNTIALQAVELCIRNTTELGSEKILPPASVDLLVPEFRAVHQVISDRISDLRKRVWW